jgi:dephospho-CoA kinase
MNTYVIGISGEPGAGKDTVKEYLVKRYGAQSLSFSLILKDILSRLSLPLARKNYAALAEALRKAFGEHILATVLSIDARNSSKSMVVIDGIRKVAELEELRRLPNFYFIFVETDLRIRYERIKRRGTKADDREKTFEEFAQDHEHAADREVYVLKEMADAVIENNDTAQSLFARIDETFALRERSALEKV